MVIDVTWEHAALVSCIMLKAPGLSKISESMQSPRTTVTGIQQQYKIRKSGGLANQMQNGAQMDIHIPSYR